MTECTLAWCCWAQRALWRSICRELIEKEKGPWCIMFQLLTLGNGRLMDSAHLLQQVLFISAVLEATTLTWSAGLPGIPEELPISPLFKGSLERQNFRILISKWVLSVLPSNHSSHSLLTRSERRRRCEGRSSLVQNFSRTQEVESKSVHKLHRSSPESPSSLRQITFSENWNAAKESSLKKRWLKLLQLFFLGVPSVLCSEMRRMFYLE